MAIKGIGNASGTVAEVETNSAALRAVLRPLDWRTAGSYLRRLTSGTMAAGLAANSNICHFRTTWPDGVCVIRKVSLSAANAGTAFAAGAVTFRMFPARYMTGVATGAVNSTNVAPNAQLRTSMGATRFAIARATTLSTVANGLFAVSTTAALTTPGATLDTDPIAAVTTSVAGVAGESILSPYLLFNPSFAQFPLVCAEWEGFTIQATVPATGTFTFAVQMEWDEIPSFS